MKENEILREIMRDAKIGWWQADRNRRVFHISEGLRDLLGVCSCEVTLSLIHISEPTRH